uniref:Uncharacterized protein n=1 Tax=Tetranychus urticae TaxID=32264 RepID=T1K045_TETUR
MVMPDGAIENGLQFKFMLKLDIFFPVNFGKCSTFLEIVFNVGAHSDNLIPSSGFSCKVSQKLIPVQVR